MNSDNSGSGNLKRSPVAIVGMGCLFPGGNDLEGFWATIRDGKDMIGPVPDSHWKVEDYFSEEAEADMTFARKGGFIEKVSFDPLHYGIPPNAVEGTDTSQLLGLVVAEKALKDAGFLKGQLPEKERTSVILGVTGALELVVPLGARLGHPIWRRALEEAGVSGDIAEDVVERIRKGYVAWQEASFPGLLGNVVAGRIANRFDLHGTNCVVDAACASSLGAVHMATMELMTGRSDLVLTGGIDTFNDIFMYMCFTRTQALSRTDAKPFDCSGDGTVLGEGLGIMALKRYSDAIKDGDRIYAVIAGTGTSSDGKGHAIYAPSVEGQKRALRNAYRASGISPSTVELVEAHGTGTTVGDGVELTGLIDVYVETNRNDRWCALGSIKSQIGHTKAAAGVAGLMKAALSIHYGVLPPSIKVSRPLDALLSPDTPFYINTKKRPWLKPGKYPRRAAVSSMGFGGSNFHVVLEEPENSSGIEKPAPVWSRETDICAFSADSIEKLIEKLEPSGIPSEKILFSNWAAKTRKAFNPEESYRIVFVVSGEYGAFSERLMKARDKLVQSGQKMPAATPDGTYFGHGKIPGKKAFLFPGQGCQKTGMFRDLACMMPEFREVMEVGEKAMADFWGRESGHGERLCDYIYPVHVFTDEDAGNAEERLKDTRLAQPALGVMAMGALRVLERFNIKPEMAGGHSYGELSALAAAKIFNISELIKLSALRGSVMAEADEGRGGMAAVEMDVSSLANLLNEENISLVAANRNGPRQTVVSGEIAEIDRACRLFSEKKIRAIKLPVSAAFHSPLVKGAKEPLQRELEGLAFEGGDIPVFANITGKTYPEIPSERRKILAGQIASPVLFDQQLLAMHDAGAYTFVEVGPGARLCGLARTILRDRPHRLIALDASSSDGCGERDLARLISQLASIGYPVDLSAWDPDAEMDENSRKPAFSIPICGANYRKERLADGTKGKSLNHQSGDSKEKPLNEVVKHKEDSDGKIKMLSGNGKNRSIMPAQDNSGMQVSSCLAGQNGKNAKTGNGNDSKILPPGPGDDGHIRQGGYVQAGEIRAGGYGPGVEMRKVKSRPEEKASKAGNQGFSGNGDNRLSGLPGNNKASESIEVSTENENSMMPWSRKIKAGNFIGSGNYADGLSDYERCNEEMKSSYKKEKNIHSRNIDGPDILEKTDLRNSVSTHDAADPGPVAEYYAEALSRTERHIENLQAFSQRTADIHRLFLETQVQAQANFSKLLDAEERLVSGIMTGSFSPADIKYLREQKQHERPDKANYIPSEQTHSKVKKTSVPIEPSRKDYSSSPGAAAYSHDTESPAYSSRQAHGSPVYSREEAEGFDPSVSTAENRPGQSNYPGEQDLGPLSGGHVDARHSISEGFSPAYENETLSGISPTHTEDLEFIAESAENTGAHEKEQQAFTAVDIEEKNVPDLDIKAMLIEVVAEKTGYPEEMLDMDMKLDADLGIDSIKRVEIMSSMAEKISCLAEVKTEVLGRVETLADVADYLEEIAGNSRNQTAKNIVEENLSLEDSPAEKDEQVKKAHVAPAEDSGQDPAGAVQGKSPLHKRTEDTNGYNIDRPGDVADSEIADTENTESPDSDKEFTGASDTSLRDAGDGTDSSDTGIMKSEDENQAMADKDSECFDSDAFSCSKIAGKTMGIRRQTLNIRTLSRTDCEGYLNIDTNGVIWIASDRNAFSEAMIPAFSASGFNARIIDIDDIPELPEEGLSGLVIAAPARGADTEFLVSVLRLLKKAGRALRKAGENGGSALWTISRLDGAFGLHGTEDMDTVSGGLAGIAKTVFREWPMITGSALDLGPDAFNRLDFVHSIVEVMLSPGPVERGFDGSNWWTTELEEQALDSKLQQALEEDDIPLHGLFEYDLVVISGGARGVTAEVAVELARTAKPAILLLGRSPLPGPEPQWLKEIEDPAAIRSALLKNAGPFENPKALEAEYRKISAGRELKRNIERIREAGALPLYWSVDIRDPDAVWVAVREAREEFGPVRGIIHGAGILADGWIEDREEEMFKNVLDTKVKGLYSLLKASMDDRPEFLILFSSSTARFGRKGQLDYACANEILNKKAQSLKGLIPLVRSMNYGPWEGGMVTPSLARLFESEGVSLINPEKGARATVAELSISSEDAVEIIISGDPGYGPHKHGLDYSDNKPDANCKEERCSEEKPHSKESKEFSEAEDTKFSSADSSDALNQREYSSSLPLALIRSVNISSHPVLQEHILGGRAVLPLAVTVEWLANAAAHLNPGFEVRGISELKLFRGIVLGEKEFMEISLHAGMAEKSENGWVADTELCIYGADSFFRYSSAKIHFGEADLITDEFTFNHTGENWAIPPENIPGLLFHGPGINLVDRVLYCSDNTIEVMTRPFPEPTQWIKNHVRYDWLVPAPALDAAFQAMILWSRTVQGKACLPNGFEKLVFEAGQDKDSVVRAVIHRISGAELTADIEISGNGLLCRLTNAKFIMDPGLENAFRQNSFTGSSTMLRGNGEDNQNAESSLNTNLPEQALYR